VLSLHLSSCKTAGLDPTSKPACQLQYLECFSSQTWPGPCVCKARLPLLTSFNITGGDQEEGGGAFHGGEDLSEFEADGDEMEGDGFEGSDGEEGGEGSNGDAEEDEPEGGRRTVFKCSHATGIE